MIGSLHQINTRLNFDNRRKIIIFYLFQTLIPHQDASGVVLSSSYDGTLKLWDLGALAAGSASSQSDAQPVRATATFSGHGTADTDSIPPFDVAYKSQPCVNVHVHNM